MPNINWGNIEEKRGGGVTNPPSGAYKCVITSATTQRTKDKKVLQLALVWDIADGEYADAFENAPATIGWKHGDNLNLEGKGLGITKHKLHVLADTNPGFKPTASIDADRWQDFVGKVCYLLVQAEITTYQGRDSYRYYVRDWLSPDEFRAGNYKVPSDIDKREAQAAPATVKAPEAPQPDLYDEDLPF